MVDIRRKNIKVNIERRANPRLEFHCDAKVIGVSEVVKITDISLGGFFFELKIKSRLKLDQIVNVIMYLPTENSPIRVKAKMVSQTERGIGCSFIDLTPKNRDSINYCFESFKDTIPIS